MSTEEKSITVALPPSDQNPRDYYVSLYLVFKTSDQIAATKSLNKGLSLLTTLLPWIAGHVSRPQGAIPRERQITWSKPLGPDNAIIPQLREAATPTGMPTLEELTRTRAPLPMGPDGVGDIPSYADPSVQSPVFGGSYIQIEGGLVVSVWAHHNVVDGHGLDVLVRLWADCCARADSGRGGHRDVPEVAPSCMPAADEPAARESTLLAAFREKLGDAEVRRIADLQDPFKHFAARHAEYTFGPVDAATRAELGKLLTRRGTWASKLFRLPIVSLERLRNLLQETAPNGDGDKKLSINNTLNALLWSIITRVKVEAGGTQSETSEFTTAVDGRGRLGLGTADSVDRSAYVGNMSLQTQAALPVSALLEASRCTPKEVSDSENSGNSGLRRIADCIARSVAALDARYFYEFYTLMGRAEQVTRLYKGFFPGGEMDLMCSSWANFGTYECDFGAGIENHGRPVFVRTPYINRLRNVMLILPRRRRDGADEVLEVVISLDQNTLEALDNDSVFQSWRVWTVDT